MIIYFDLSEDEIKEKINNETLLFGDISRVEAHIELKHGFELDSIIKKYGNHKIRVRRTL